MVKVEFACDGCDNAVTVPAHARYERVSHSFSRRTLPTFKALEPEGWQAFDAYTSACYCPECWRKILNEDDLESE